MKYSIGYMIEINRIPVITINIFPTTVIIINIFIPQGKIQTRTNTLPV